MKKSKATHKYVDRSKLSIRLETVRILTEHELSLVVAGNCVYGSAYTQQADTKIVGTC
jgi:hypothetical protein